MEVGLGIACRPLRARVSRLDCHGERCKTIYEVFGGSMAVPDYESTVSRVYESILDPTGWLGAMRLIMQSAGGSRASRFRFNLTSGEACDFSTLGFEQIAQDAYVAHYAALDPSVHHVAASPVGKWHGDSELLDPHSRSQQEYIRDWALPNGVGGLCGAKLLAAGDSAVYLSVHREPGAPMFGQQGRAVFERLMPHLMRAERLRERMRLLSDDVAVAHGTLDQFAAAAFVVDRNAGLRAANTQAERLFADSSSVVVLHGKVCLSAPALSPRLAEAVRQAMPPVLNASAFLVPQTTQSAQLHVMVLPLSRALMMSRLSDRALALVVVVDPGASQPTRDLFRSIYALTVTEAALASAIAQGATLKEWADARHVAISTARTHLATVFQKTGASTQAQLVRLVRALPAVVGDVRSSGRGRPPH
jgi:DNA-binding CsgD family transcriptional regulator